MKKSRKIIIYSLFSVFVLYYFIFNHTQMKYWQLITKSKFESDNIEFSKALGYQRFQGEFKSKYPYYVFLGDTIHIDEAWVERGWASGRYRNRINEELIRDTNYFKERNASFIINTKNDFEETNLREKATPINTIRNGYGHTQFPSKYKQFYFKLRDYDIGDTVEILIFRGWHTYSPDVDREINIDSSGVIGKMTFYRVKE